MTVVQQFIQFLKSLLVWWFIVSPWEQAIRVRFGSRVRLFQPGIYWKLPFFDQVYKQNVPKRICSLPVQTLTSRDGLSLTLHGTLAYKIVDILKLHQTLHDAEESIWNEVLGPVSEYVSGNDLNKCRPEQIIAHVNSLLDLDQYGLGDTRFFLTAYIAGVKTIRLLQDKILPYSISRNFLDTDAIDGVKAS